MSSHYYCGFCDARVPDTEECLCQTSSQERYKDRIAELERERDALRDELSAYIKAKAENDERFMLERDEARLALEAERERVRAILRAVENHAEGGNIENYRYLSDKLEALTKGDQAERGKEGGE